jgi:hypothetical protein
MTRQGGLTDPRFHAILSLLVRLRPTYSLFP